MMEVSLTFPAHGNYPVQPALSYTGYDTVPSAAKKPGILPKIRRNSGTGTTPSVEVAFDSGDGKKVWPVSLSTEFPPLIRVLCIAAWATVSARSVSYDLSNLSSVPVSSRSFMS